MASMFKRILVPTDGSELAAKAVTMAIGLARTHGASLVALHVFPPLPGVEHSAAAPLLKQLEGDYEKHQREQARDILHSVAKKAVGAGVNTQELVVESEDVYARIVEAAKQYDCDLICMASHGRRGVAAVVLGSETHKVLTHSHIPVLVVR
jgi:nucleotide-binding universal stress UspA family protein